jgi:hypothetical protein
MKILKRILIGILSVVALLLIIALFISRDYRIEREIVVNKPNSDVFSYIRYTKNQDHFNKWIQSDPQMAKAFRGEDGTVGFVYAWNSKGSGGQGEQEISNISEGKRVDYAIRFIRPMEAQASLWITTDALAANQTKVKWGMQSRNPYPMNLLNLFVPKMLGNDLQTSLGNLKSILEKQ